MSPEETLTSELSLLNDLIVQDILIAKAATMKLEVPANDLDTAFNNAKKNISDDAFQQELSRRKLTAADMREGVRRELLAQKVIAQEVGSKIAVTDQEVTDFFNANRAQFNVAEEAYHIAQIVVTPVARPASRERHRRRCRDAGGGGGKDADADGAPEGRRVVPRPCRRLFRRPGVGAARRRPGLRPDLAAPAGARRRCATPC